jgi:serine/threonine protein kinase
MRTVWGVRMLILTSSLQEDPRLMFVLCGWQEVFEARISTEFENEVNMLSQVEHLNLVKLIGYLEEGDERILVTEYVPNGNLRRHLDGTLVMKTYMCIKQ